MRPRLAARVSVAAILLTACGTATATSTAIPGITANLQPLNGSLLPGPNRIAVAVLDQSRNPLPITDATLSVERQGKVIAERPLENISAVYGGIPDLVGSVDFPSPGEYQYVLHGRHGAQSVGGSAYVNVFATGEELAIGARVPAVQQKILGDPGITLAMVDSGLPPDNWHSATIAQGLAEHRPMVLYFGEPGYCTSRTCGPTVQILQQLCATYCGRMLFEHLEDHVPAGASGPVNPAFTAFGLRTEPWIYFVTATGVVSDRYEGPVTLRELRDSAAGTLADRVPAAPVT